MTEIRKKHGPAFLAIGSELLDGRVHETNALFTARTLADAGVSLSRVALCDDVETEILATLDLLARDASVIIVSGGLGPTTDDLTREALARYCGVELYEDSGALGEIEELFARRKRAFYPTNRKQATFPRTSTIISNPIGTAPGFWIETQKGGKTLTLASLPGVPGEFIEMFTHSVLPLIRERLGMGAPPPRQVIRTFGLPESEVGARVEALNLDSSLIISYRAHFPEIQTKIIHPHDAALVTNSMRRVEESVGTEYIFARCFDGSFEDAVVEALSGAGKTVALAESCTGGAVANLLTNVPGSSRVFAGGTVTYSDQSKVSLLGVSANDIRNDGAVSAGVVTVMAMAAREQFSADIGLAVSGIAGPDGGSSEKPVGTFFVALATSEGVESFKLFMLSSRAGFKRYVACVVLDIARRYVSGLTLEPYRNPPIPAGKGKS